MEIDHFFTLRPAELDAVLKIRRTSNRLGLALHIGFLRFSGTSLNSTDLIPPAVLAHIGKQIAPEKRAPQIASIRSVYKRRSTLFEHHQDAANVLGFRKLAEGAGRNLFGYLRKEVWDTLEDEELTFHLNIILTEEAESNSRIVFWLIKSPTSTSLVSLFSYPICSDASGRVRATFHKR